MPNRIRPLEEKVKSVRKALDQINIEAAAREASVAPSTLSYDLGKVREALPEILVNRTPGPKPKAKEAGVGMEIKEVDRPEKCRHCGGRHIWKNGTYEVINWVWLLTVGWLIGVPSIVIQRFRCADCGQELVSPERQRQAEARQAWWPLCMDARWPLVSSNSKHKLLGNVHRVCWNASRTVVRRQLASYYLMKPSQDWASEPTA
jgi:DNA-directed RNA polymerase subunit RPC12/RpoP